LQIVLNKPATKGLPWPSGQRLLTRNQDLSLWVSIPTRTSNFSTPDWQKNQQGTPVWLIIICNDYNKVVVTLSTHCLRPNFLSQYMELRDREMGPDPTQPELTFDPQ